MTSPPGGKPVIGEGDDPRARGAGISNRRTSMAHGSAERTGRQFLNVRPVSLSILPQ